MSAEDTTSLRIVGDSMDLVRLSKDLLLRQYIARGHEVQMFNDVGKP